jgi:DNA-binding XRE family transcriptional regulator
LLAIKQAAIFCELNREQIEDIFWKNAVREFNVPWD